MLQATVFVLVTAGFTNIYITQPVLPVISAEFGVNETQASLSVSAVILGIALSILPFGKLADRYSIRPIILVGGLAIAISGLVCAQADTFEVLVVARNGGDFSMLLQRSYESDLKYFRDTCSATSVQIISVGGQACGACSELADKVYTIDEALEEMPLPCKSCTTSASGEAAAGWCQCEYLPIIT